MKKMLFFSCLLPILFCSFSTASGQWTAQTSGTAQNLRAVHFINADTGWVMGDSGKVLHTEDGGTNWVNQVDPFTQQLNGVFFINADTGWAAGNTGTIIKTINGGANWDTLSNNTSQNLQDVRFLDSNNGWVVGASHTMLHTSDGGINWIHTDTVGTESGTPQTLHSVFFTDTDTGWIVGSSGRIFHTTNGGTSWTRQATGITSLDLYTVYFFNSNIGWAGGANGTLLHTTNGGNLWILQNSGSPYEIHGPFFTSSRCGWFVDINTGIFYTSDRGTHWSAITDPTSQPYYDIYFPDSYHGWTVGGAGTILKCQMLTSGDASLNQSVTSGDVSLILQYTVNKITLSAAAFAAADVSGNGKVNAFDASLILRWLVNIITTFPAGDMIMYPKEAFRNTDISLTRLDEDDNFVQYAINIKNAKDVYASEISLNLNGLEFVDCKKTNSTAGYFMEVNTVGDVLMIALSGTEPLNNEGEIVKLRFKKISEKGEVRFNSVVLNDVEITVTGESLLNTPEKYELSQNYPNPFNPETSIRYQLPENCRVNLSVYNIIGQKIRTLIENDMDGGYHSVTWDGRNNFGEAVSSGIYFYTMRTSTGFVQSRKLMFLK